MHLQRHLKELELFCFVNIHTRSTTGKDGEGQKC
jgi:hypothetical protein